MRTVIASGWGWCGYTRKNEDRRAGDGAGIVEKHRIENFHSRFML